MGFWCLVGDDSDDLIRLSSNPYGMPRSRNKSFKSSLSDKNMVGRRRNKLNSNESPQSVQDKQKKVTHLLFDKVDQCYNQVNF